LLDRELQVDDEVGSVGFEPNDAGIEPELDADLVENRDLEQAESLLAPSVPAAEPVEELIICLDLPDPETEIERLERVVRWTVEQLELEGVPLPGNISRDEQAQLPQHSACYVYRFGVRRLHLSLREAEAGRLLLIVRTGGGFSDFASFCRRHGRTERARYLRLSQPLDLRASVRNTSRGSRRSIIENVLELGGVLGSSTARGATPRQSHDSSVSDLGEATPRRSVELASVLGKSTPRHRLSARNLPKPKLEPLEEDEVAASAARLF